jgi:hypothetical protein
MDAVDRVHDDATLGVALIRIIVRDSITGVHLIAGPGDPIRTTQKGRGPHGYLCGHGVHVAV